MPDTANVEHLWFLDTLASVHVASSQGTAGLSVLERRAPYGESPALHLHRAEDEVFYILEGELRFQAGQEERRLGPGQSMLAPQGVPHTYRVESRAGAHWLTITTRGDFERFMRALARPAEKIALPPPTGEPTPEAIQLLTETARAHGIEIVGPPLH
jgi:quercetin dioxygenase-like cupin family protein